MQQDQEDSRRGERLSDPGIDTEISTEVFETWTPQRLLTWAIDLYHPRVALTCSLSVEDTVVAHMIQEIEPDVPIIFIDTDFHFPETLDLLERLTEVLEWNLQVYRPSVSVEEQERAYGSELYLRRPDLCCWLRKVEPMKRALAELDVWVTGMRREQATTRRSIGRVERHELDNGRTILKVNPLAAWTRDQVWDHIRGFELPYNPLYDRGYMSIGCAPCTEPVQEGDDERAGRWRGQGKTECGLHTFTNRRP